MTEQTKNYKYIDPLALATLSCGTVLNEEGFGPAAEAAEWVMGHPIFTHQFAFQPLAEKLKEKVLELYPDMPTEQPTDLEATIADVKARYPHPLLVKRGTGDGAVDPISSLAELLSEKKEVTS